MYELHCQTINRKCALDRHVSVKTVALNTLLDRTSLDSMHNVPDFLASQNFLTFSRSMLKCKILFFLDLQYPSYSNDFKNVLYRFLICYIVLWQYEVNSDSKHRLFQRAAFFCVFLHYLKKKPLIYCVTRKKVAWNKRMSTVKHICLVSHVK